MQTIERFAAGRRRAARRAAFGIAAGLLAVIGAAAAATAYFFPTAAKSAFRATTAIIAQSWSGAFEGTGGGSGGGGSGADILGSAPEEIPSVASDSARGVAADIPPGTTVLPGAASVAGGGNDTAAGAPVAASDAAGSHADEIPAADGARVPSGLPTTTPPGEESLSFPFSPPDVASPAPAAKIPSPCDIASAALEMPSRAAFINEIAWMGSPPRAGETAEAAGNREWIELANFSASPLDVSGWQLEDAAGKLDIVIGRGDAAVIPAGGFYLLERGGGPAESGTIPGIEADQGYAGALSNEGATLTLFGPGCAVADRISAVSGWPGGDNTDKRTLERDADGYGWHTSVDPGGTPKAKNSVPAPVSAGGGGGASGTGGGNDSNSGATSTAEEPPCAIAEVSSTVIEIAAVQIAGDAPDNDFVKLFNPSAVAVDVGGWKLKKKSATGAEYSLRTFPLGSTVPAEGYFVWANGGNGFGAAIHANATSSETLAADNSVALFDASGTVMDAVAWGTGEGQYGEGAPYPADPGAGQALARKFSDGAIRDTGDNAADFTL